MIIHETRIKTDILISSNLGAVQLASILALLINKTLFKQLFILVILIYMYLYAFCVLHGDT